MAVQIGARLVSVDTVATSASRALPGEPLPDWAGEPTAGTEVPATASVRDWGGRHLMVLFTLTKSRRAGADHPAIAIAITLGARYEIAFAPADPDPAPDGDILSVLSDQNLDAIVKLASRDVAPFARQAVYAASTSVDPTGPILLTGLEPSASVARSAGPLSGEPHSSGPGGHQE